MRLKSPKALSCKDFNILKTADLSLKCNAPNLDCNGTDIGFSKII